MKLVKNLFLITLVISFVGCGVLSEPEIRVNEDSNVEGISNIKINIGGNGRTILPIFKDTYSKFVINAEPDTGKGNTETAPDPVEIYSEYYYDYESGSGYYWIPPWGDIRVPYGDWFISVTAYISVEVDDVYEDFPVARGSIPFEVNEMSHYIVIPVNAPVTEGRGEFDYNVVYPSNGTISLTLDTWPITTSVYTDDNFASGDFHSYEIDSGVYFLTISVTVESKIITRNEIVHIHQQSVTLAQYNFMDDF